jgi:hypothetical protein
MSKWRESYKVHPAADVFPMLKGDELTALVADIKANGLRQPIVMSDDELLCDGRNRLEAMELAGVSTENVDRIYIAPKDAVSAIISANVHRRHLTKLVQAEMIVAACKLNGGYPAKHGEVSAEPHKGGRGKVNDVKAKAVAEAAALKNPISKRTIERAFEKATDHPNAPQPLRAKARRQKKRETLQADRQLLATLPRNVDGWRRRYLEAVSRQCVDIAAEMTAVVDALQKIADQPEAERLKSRAAHR